ncbi:MAG: response regulator [Pseudolabrys sp.]|nr:response regulator [Pseudolabrys sp.]
MPNPAKVTGTIWRLAQPQRRSGPRMKPTTINLKNLAIAVADSNAFVRRIVVGILRGFGATKVIEIESSTALHKILSAQKIDMLLCDVRLAPQGGLAATKAIRRDPGNENRTIPILILSSDTRDTTVKAARDAGAHIVIAKPLSPNMLYDKLAWIAFNPRQFVDVESYFGPDRRFKIEGYPGGIGRRKGDRIVELTAESGPALQQNEIDSLFSAARMGQSE